MRLPKARTNKIKTVWADDVDPMNPLKEYPRPQCVRDEWMNLNGPWEYAVTDAFEAQCKEFEGTITVPFCLESELSGVGKKLLPGQKLWYRKRFVLDRAWDGQTILLHFGAVDWKAEVCFNGQRLGTHTGGYTPFSFELPEPKFGKENELLVCVIDNTDSGEQQTGKQILAQKDVFYTPISGIWQTVWLEPVNKTYIKSFTLTPDTDSSTLTVRVYLNQPEGTETVLSVLCEDKLIAQVTGVSDSALTVELGDPHLWCPDDPFLYDLKIDLIRDGVIADSVVSYFAMRSFGKMPDKNGIMRMTLNNRFIFQNGVLDQGYWPDGLYTAPTDEALYHDVLMAKEAGFNMIRKHIKVESDRWYYWCDKLGVIVWQDIVSGGKRGLSIPQILKMSVKLTNNIGIDDTKDSWFRKCGKTSEFSRHQYEVELEETMGHLYNFPCIGVWVLFNEAWGQFDSRRMTEKAYSIDRTRLIDHASGWLDQGAGDMQSHHMYRRSYAMPVITNKRRVFTISEYGGIALLIPEHEWCRKRFGYRFCKTTEELTAMYTDIIQNYLLDLKRQGCSGVVYTQLTDVEHEINGIYTYDRRVPKMNIDEIRKTNTELINAGL